MQWSLTLHYIICQSRPPSARRIFIVRHGHYIDCHDIMHIKMSSSQSDVSGLCTCSGTIAFYFDLKVLCYSISTTSILDISTCYRILDIYIIQIEISKLNLRYFIQTRTRFSTGVGRSTKGVRLRTGRSNVDN